MKYLYSPINKIIFTLSLVFFFQPIQAAVAVITHPNIKDIGFSKSKLAKIYLGKLKRHSNGETIKAANLPKDTAAYKKFHNVVVKKSGAALNRYWSKLKYTGKGKPPKTISSTRELIKWVANTKGAIGYIDGKYLNKSVNVVLILP
ncbi:MAG: hypothetical protein QM484_05430 [Woeseiaceae bacterium]